MMVAWPLFALALIITLNVFADASRLLHLQSGSSSTIGRDNFFEGPLPGKFFVLSHEEMMSNEEKHLFIVQVDAEHRLKLSEVRHQLSQIVTVVGYFPDYAFLVYASYASMLAAHRLSPEIIWTGFHRPIDRLASNLASNATLLHSSDELIVSLVDVLNPDEDEFPAGDQVRSGKRIIYRLSAEDILEQLILALIHHPKVLFVEHHAPSKLLNDYSATLVMTGRETGDRKSVSPTLAKLQGEGQVMGVTDSGLDYNHCFYAESDSKQQPPPFTTWSPTPPATIPAANAARRKIIQYVTYADNADLNPALNGHGTHVSGTAVGSPFNVDTASNGFISHRGLAANARIAFFDIGPATGGSLQLPPDVASGLLAYSYAAGARVSCNAWGSPSSSAYDTKAFDMDLFMFENKDFIVAIAAGNSGWCGLPGTVLSPASCKNGLAVGASDQPEVSFFQSFSLPLEVSEQGVSHYGINHIASFSSSGPTIDGRIKPDVVTPGFTITSACSRQTNTDCAAATSSATMCVSLGTSTAVPSASGALVQIRQYLMDGYWPTGVKVAGNGFTPSGALLKALIINGAVHMTGQRLMTSKYRMEHGGNDPVCMDAIYRDIGTTLPNNDQGFGRVQIDRSVFFQDQSRGYIQWFPGHTTTPDKVNFGDRVIRTGETHMYPFCVWPNSVQVRIALVWMDGPATQGATILLVNDLDLTVATSNPKVTFFGNMGKKPDRRNPVEVVHFESTGAMLDITVNVTGHLVAVSSSPGAVASPYALVVAGKLAPGTCATAVLPSYYVEPIVESKNWLYEIWKLIVENLLLFALGAFILAGTTCCLCCRLCGSRHRHPEEQRAAAVPDVVHHRRGAGVALDESDSTSAALHHAASFKAIRRRQLSRGNIVFEKV